VQRELQQQQTTLAGLYEGNPKRSTSRPTTELLLRAFQSITLTAAALPDRRILHLTVLTPGSLVLGPQSFCAGKNALTLSGSLICLLCCVNIYQDFTSHSVRHDVGARVAGDGCQQVRWACDDSSATTIL
jgi:hypothetical protein